MGFDKSANKPKPKPESISPSPIEEVEELPDEIFTQSVNLKSSKKILLFKLI
jgi:hypothetical protein